MSRVEKILKQMEDNPGNTRFDDLKRICEYYFGMPRQSSSSHVVYKTPWKGDPRVNIQNKDGMAKPYQVRQVLKAIKRLKDENSSE
jgi:hypothetical protein